MSRASIVPKLEKERSPREQATYDKALDAIQLTSSRLYDVAVAADKELDNLPGTTFTNKVGDQKPYPQIKVLIDCNNQLRQNVKMLKDLRGDVPDDLENKASVLTEIQAKRQARLTDSDS